MPSCEAAAYGGGRRPEGPPPRPAGAAGADTKCREKCKHGKEFLRSKSDPVRARPAQAGLKPVFSPARARKQGRKHAAWVRRCAIQRMDSIIQRLQNDLCGLRNLHEFGWLRANELGLLLWPENSSNAVAASRVIRSWISRQLVLPRKLPDRAGIAVVLSRKGVQFLAEHGVEASTGTAWGKTIEGQWQPPPSWRHDLLAAGVLCSLSAQGWEVLPEAMLLRLPSKPPKLPDGLAKPPATEQQPDPKWHWVEVENAHKSGKRMQELAKALYLAAKGEIKPVGAIYATAAMVAYTDVQTRAGHSINHGQRVMTAIDAETDPGERISVVHAYATLRGHSISSLELKQEEAQPNGAAKIVRVLDANGWKYDQGTGSYVSHYGDCQARIWQSFERGGFVYQVQRGDTKSTPANAPTKQGAKLASGIAISKLRKGP